MNHRNATWLVVLLLSMTNLASADESEEKALTIVRELGGRIVRDGKVDGKSVVEVYLSKPRLNNEMINDLTALKNLSTLSLRGADVANLDLSRLRAFANLRWLALDDTNLTDAGLK